MPAQGQTSQTMHLPLITGRGIHNRDNPHRVDRPHGTDCWILEYSVRAGGVIDLPDGTAYATDAHELFLIEPGVPQHYGMDPRGERWDHFYVTFIARQEWLPWMNWPELVAGFHYLKVTEQAIHQQLMQDFSDAVSFANRPLHRKWDFVMNLTERILLLADTFNPNQRHAALDSRVRTATELLCARFQEKISIAELAAACSLSPSRFSHLFQSETGLTPMQYLERHRIERARAMLAMTVDPVGIIARRVGFDCPFYFSRIFRRHAGCSPREYRQRMQKP